MPSVYVKEQLHFKSIFKNHYMKVSKNSLIIISFGILASAWLIYRINLNHRRTIENSFQLNVARQKVNSIDAILYKITHLELNSQKYVITGDTSLEKKALEEIAELKQMAVDFDSTSKTNQAANVFPDLLFEKINIQKKIIEENKVSHTEARLLIGSVENTALTNAVYESLNTLKADYSDDVTLLRAERKKIDFINFKTSVIIVVCSIVFILLTLAQVIKNKWLRKLAQTDTREMEKKYKNLIEDSGVGLLTTDLNGNITFINKRITSFTGFHSDEIIGKHFSSLVETEWAQIINERFKKQFQLSEYEWIIQYPLKVKSGDMIWVEQSNVILSENGAAKGFQCILKDITEKRKIEAELKKIELERAEYQFRLQSILDNTPLIIFIKDLEGKYLLANESYRNAFNFTNEEIIGKTDFELGDESDALRYKEIDEYVIKEKKNVEIEETVHQDGVTKNLLIVKFPLFDKNNNIYGIGGIASDITERYLYGMHLIEAKSKAEMAEQLQEQFLANMSHEIRTPMNGIIGMTNILLASSVSDEQRDFLQVIKKSSDSLMVLMNDILDLSKIKAGKLRIEKIDFRLRETLEHTISTFRVLIKEKGLTLRVSVGLNVPDSLTGDPHRLNQILNNLLSNAIKFTPQGEIKLEIKAVKQNKNEAELSFSITDTGIGIPDEKQQLIFDSFSQAESGTSRKFGGSGLGLSITKKLIEMQGGTIEVNSVQGKGTEFNFAINYKIAAHTVARQYDNVKQETFNQDGLAGKRILVVEDNEANQKVIYHMLNKVGIETDLADNGKVAIQLLEQGFEYDLIIMDLQMPEMDGFETTVYLREKLKITIPIIAMTASALRNEKIKCMELGMNEYLNKPFVPADLFRELRRFLLKKEEDNFEKNQPSVYNESKKLYSLNHLIELDDIDCLCEVLQLFVESTPVSMNEIKEAISEENWEEVYKKSHKIKSSIGILQMGKLMSLISKIESDAKERKNLEEIPATFDKANELFLKINPMIEAELQNALKLVLKN
jgi:PAS domain S-box-containing protein